MNFELSILAAASLWGFVQLVVYSHGYKAENQEALLQGLGPFGLLGLGILAGGEQCLSQRFWGNAGVSAGTDVRPPGHVLLAARFYRKRGELPADWGAVAIEL